LASAIAQFSRREQVKQGDGFAKFDIYSP